MSVDCRSLGRRSQKEPATPIEKVGAMALKADSNYQDDECGEVFFCY